MRRPHGHARIDEENPEQTAICDRCARLWNRSSLAWQWDWAGLGMVNKRILVCADCMDEPAPFLRMVILPPDPPPSYNVRRDGQMTIDGANVLTILAPPGLQIFRATGGMSVELQLN